MVDVSWPTSNNPGSAPGEGSGRLINCYAYKDGSAPRWRPVPGLAPFAPLPLGDWRGELASGGLLYAVVGRSLLQIAPDGSYQAMEGQIAGDGPVTMARNNKATLPDITIVSSIGATVLAGTVVKRYPDPHLPVPNSVSFLDGYFLWTTASGDIWASALNDTAVNALSVARAEARPDGLLRGVVWGQQFFAFGDQSIEVWQDAGTSPFPLSRSTVIPLGLFGPWAVAGYEPGWGGSLIFVASDNSVRSLDGYTPTRISNEDLERLIEAVADKRSLRAEVYTFGANSIWSLSCDAWTWEYNVTTGSWHERQSYGASRWRAAATVLAFGQWLAADRAGGALYALDTDARSEGPDALVWGMDSGQVKQFPSRIAVPGAAFDFVLGQAAIPNDPEVMLSWTHDGGASWANPVMRKIGKHGAMRGRVTVNRMGLSTAQGIALRFRVSDPAYTSFAGARMDVQDRK